MQGYLGSTVYIHKRTNYIQVFFDNSESLETLKQKIFTKQDDSTFQFVDLESVKQTPTSEQIDLENAKTIQVIDIPLGVKTPIIRSTFEQLEILPGLLHKLVACINTLLLHMKHNKWSNPFSILFGLFLS